SATQTDLFPDLPNYSRGLPTLTRQPCDAGCRACAEICPTDAITVAEYHVTLDRGLCIACGECSAACPTETIVEDRRTTVAVRRRSDLILTNSLRSRERLSVDQTLSTSSCKDPLLTFQP